MRAKILIMCTAIALTGAGSIAYSQTGEDYGQQPPRLPRSVYENMTLPPDTPNTAPPPPAVARSETQEVPTCQGTGCPPTEVAVAQKLLASGPDTTELYNSFESPKHQFAEVGFAQEGWPLSIEYEAEPGTVTILRIKLYHERKIWIVPIPFFEVAYEANLDALDSEVDSGNPWHRTVSIPAITLSREADAAADAGLHVARYEVRSYRLVNGSIDRRQRAPLNLIGIAVGREVVGSLTLSSSQFDARRYRIPASGSPPADLRFRYKADRNYDLVKARIERYSNQQLAYGGARDLGSPHSATQNQTTESSWKITRQQAAGRYRASVVGWLKCQGATILQRMSSCASNPAWSVANSGPVELYK